MSEKLEEDKIQSVMQPEITDIFDFWKSIWENSTSNNTASELWESYEKELKKSITISKSQQKILTYLLV